MPEEEMLEVDGREIRVTNPAKIFVPDRQITKLDVVRYTRPIGFEPRM